MTEQGPFRPNSDGTLSLNEYTWNKVSNMVFFESPVGVGFSYTDDKTLDYMNMGDTQTAIDNYNLIQAFLVRFPHFINSSLYLTSESYGGHYIPTLAQLIVDSNESGNNQILNFKGFAIGNPYTDVYSSTPSMVDTYWGHQLISQPTYETYLQACGDKPKSVNIYDHSCRRALIDVINSIGTLNRYALDYPVCTTGRAQRIWFFNSQFSFLSQKERNEIRLPSVESYEPCEDDYTSTYLNRDDVKTAIHVNTTLKWRECSDAIFVTYNSTDSRNVSTAPIYNYLIDGGYGLDILIYSG